MTNRGTHRAGDTDLGSQIASGTVARLSSAVVGFVGVLLFARILGPNAFGGFYVLFSISKIVDRPIIGWAEGAKKRFSEAASDRAEIFGSVLIFGVIWTAIVGIAAMVVSGPLDTQIVVSGGAGLLVLLIVAEAGFEAAERLVDGTGRVSLSTWGDASRSFLTFPAQLWLVLIGLGVAGMAIGLAAPTLVVVLGLFYALHITPTLPSRGTIRSIWGYAKYSIPDSLLGATYARFDILLLGILLTQSWAGIYEAAAKLTIPAIFLSEVGSRGLMARVSDSSSRGGEIVSDSENVISFASILAFPILFGAIALSESLMVTAYGGAYAQGATLLIGIGIARLIESQTHPLSAILSGLDHPRTIVRISFISLSTNIVLGVVLLLSIGALGVVIATIISELIAYTLLAISVRSKVSSVTLFPKLLMKQAGAAIGMLAVLIAITRFITLSGWASVVGVVLIGAIVYSGILILTSNQIRHTASSFLTRLSSHVN